jgi:hypothetical protein
VACWLVGSGAALWAFEQRDAQPYRNGAASLADFRPLTREAERWFMAQPFAARRAGGKTVTWVHIREADCRCNPATDAHVARIRGLYPDSHVQFETIDRAALRGTAAGVVGSTPAAMVFDTRGHLAYFGPYSDSARCGSSPGFVERTLERLARGELPEPLPILASGCFCNPADTAARGSPT